MSAKTGSLLPPHQSSDAYSCLACGLLLAVPEGTVVRFHSLGFLRPLRRKRLASSSPGRVRRFRGHVPALTVHWTVIHSRNAAARPTRGSLPARYDPGKAFAFERNVARPLAVTDEASASPKGPQKGESFWRTGSDRERSEGASARFRRKNITFCYITQYISICYNLFILLYMMLYRYVYSLSSRAVSGYFRRILQARGRFRRSPPRPFPPRSGNATARRRCR